MSPSERTLSLLFRVGKHLLAIDALAVRSALLRSDVQVDASKAKPMFQHQGKAMPVHVLAPWIGATEVEEVAWAAILVIAHGPSEFALGVGRCEVVRPVRLLAPIPVSVLTSRQHIGHAVFSAKLRSEHTRESLGIAVDVAKLAKRALELRA
jgi:CheW-like domain